MNSQARLVLIALVSLLGASLTLAPDSALAQEGDAAESAESSEETADEAAESDGEKSQKSKENKERESAHGDYKFKPSYGGGFEYGVFFSDLSRWNSNLLAPNDASNFTANALSTFTFSVEASFLEGTRLSAFAGVESPFSSNPGITAVYGGLEPAFAFRNGMWEMAIGLGIGIGKLKLDLDNGDGFESGVVALRPALEVRRYIGEIAAAYVRFGFNQWLPFNGSGDGLSLNARNGTPTQMSDLNEGAPWLGIGARFGHYPKHVKHVPDTDGDELRDDIDDCVDAKEDKDDFEDYDGCPDPDNDGDGVKDDNDECPTESEDVDEWEDQDGCPEEDDDHDKDGILTKEDECPRQAEDKDDFEDEDGCPDTDNDEDGVKDEDDECRDEPGIPANNGCPSEIVTIGEKMVMVDAAVDFEPAFKEGERPSSPKGLPDSVALTDTGKSTLEEVAQTLQLHEELAQVEVGAHTAEGPDKVMSALSKLQAEAVKAYLVEQGVAEGRLTAKGYGDSKPTAPKDAEGAEKKDADKKPTARVEFKILKRKETEANAESENGDKEPGVIKRGAE